MEKTERTRQEKTRRNLGRGEHRQREPASLIHSVIGFSVVVDVGVPAHSCSHVGVVDEGPSSWSLQDVVQEVLQSPVEGVSLGRLLPSGNAAALTTRPLLNT